VEEAFFFQSAFPSCVDVVSEHDSLSETVLRDIRHGRVHEAMYRLHVDEIAQARETP